MDISSELLASLNENNINTINNINSMNSINSINNIKMFETDQADINLIKRVQSKSLLYDKNNPLYKNLYLREKAWKGIAQELGIPVDVAKRKWRILRDRFKKYYLKWGTVLAHGETKPTWKYFEHMKFLLEFYDMNDNSSESFKQNHQIVADYQGLDVDILKSIDPTLATAEWNGNGWNGNDESSAATSTLESIQVDQSDFIENIYDTKEQIKDDKPPDNENQSLNAADVRDELHSLLRTVTEILQDKPKRCHISTFFESMAMKVEEAKLPPVKLMELEEKILQVVNGAILEHLQTSQNLKTETYL